MNNASKNAGLICCAFVMCAALGLLGCSAQATSSSTNSTASSASSAVSAASSASSAVEANADAAAQAISIQANGATFTAQLEDNSSAAALAELLASGPITIDMHDYSNFEKVGNLGTSLPTNNEQITTVAGDVILYQGNQITIYYDQNSWNFTRLGHIENATRETLLEALGTGDVEVTLSLV